MKDSSLLLIAAGALFLLWPRDEATKQLSPGTGSGLSLTMPAITYPEINVKSPEGPDYSGLAAMFNSILGPITTLTTRPDQTSPGIWGSKPPKSKEKTEPTGDWTIDIPDLIPGVDINLPSAPEITINKPADRWLPSIKWPQPLADYGYAGRSFFHTVGDIFTGQAFTSEYLNNPPWDAEFEDWKKNNPGYWMPVPEKESNAAISQYSVDRFGFDITGLLKFKPVPMSEMTALPIAQQGGD